MAFDIKQMDASVVGSTVVLDETELSVQTKDLATVDSESSVDTVLGVKDGEVVQMDVADLLSRNRPSYMPSPIKFVMGSSSGYVAANGTKNFDMIGDSAGGAKAILFVIGGAQNNLAIILLNTTSSAALHQTTFCNGDSPVTVARTSYEGEVAHCTFTNNATASYLLFLVFRGDVVLT